MINLDNNETIRSAINDIIPADCAKERMLANIKRKAKTKETKPITVRLTKWAAPLAACLAAAVITAVGVRVIPTQNKTPDVSEPTKVGSTMRLVDSAAAFDKELGISIDAPEGSKNVQYRILDDAVADISFAYNDIDCTLRASERNVDFSGITGTAFSSELIGGENEAMLTTVTNFSNETYLKLEWNNGKTRYILSCKDNEAANNPADNKTSDQGSYSHTQAANNIIELYSLIK